MTAAATVPDAALRQRRLRALGVEPLVLRPAFRRDAADPEPEPGTAATPAVMALPAEVLRVVAVLPKAERARAADAMALLAAFGIAPGCVAWFDAEALPASLPAVPAYVAFGHAAARALGAELPGATREAAMVLVTDTGPAQWVATPGARRAVWQALRPLRRVARGG